MSEEVILVITYKQRDLTQISIKYYELIFLTVIIYKINV